MLWFVMVCCGIMDPPVFSQILSRLEAAFSKDQCKDPECADLNVWHRFGCPRLGVWSGRRRWRDIWVKAMVTALVLLCGLPFVLVI